MAKSLDQRRKAAFGLGSFLMPIGMFLILGRRHRMLRLVEASTTEYKELSSAPVLSGDNVWGPMALSDGKLVLAGHDQNGVPERGAHSADEDCTMRIVWREGSAARRSADKFTSFAARQSSDRVGRIYAAGDSELKSLMPWAG